MKRIATICARGGSQGVKNKNVRTMHGKPLIAHTIEHIRQAGIFDTYAVSSDSGDILDVAKSCGVPHIIKRPDELASGTAPKVPAIRHCVQQVEKITGDQYDICVDLDATAPLRHAADIIEAVRLLEDSGASNVFSVTPAHRSPYFNMVEKDNSGKVTLCKGDGGFVRRQDVPDCYDVNASIYVWLRDVLENEDKLLLDNTDIYVMPPERSQDIDSEYDWLVVEYLMGLQQRAD